MRLKARLGTLREPDRAALAVAGALALTVFLVHADFGMTWDEAVELYDPIRGTQGPRAWAFWTGGLAAEHATFDQGHSPFILLAYHMVQRVLEAVGVAPPPVDTFHILTGLIGVLGFWLGYRLARRVLPPWWALGAAALAFLAPRMFGHSFGNFKDHPFAVAWLGALLATIRAAEEPSWRRMITLGCAFGLLLALRLGGLVLVPIAGIALLAGALRSTPPAWGARIGRGLVAAGLGLAIAYATFPYLLVHPVAGFSALLSAQTDFPWKGATLTLGQDLSAAGLPWWYASVWLGVTLPEIVLAGLLLAVGALAWARRPPSTALIVIALGALVPLAYVSLARTPLYDGARHLLFVAPPLTFLAVLGWRALHTRLPRTVVPAVLALGGAWLAVQLVVMHPLQTVWFNQLAGGPRGAAGQFTFDYWCSSSRLATRWLAGHGRPPRVLCAVGCLRSNLGAYLPTWSHENADSLADAALDCAWAYVPNRNRILETAEAYAGRHPELWRAAHRIERGGATMGVVFRSRTSGSDSPD